MDDKWKVVKTFLGYAFAKDGIGEISLQGICDLLNDITTRNKELETRLSRKCEICGTLHLDLSKERVFEDFECSDCTLKKIRKEEVKE